ncbi:hypothetical protein SGRA_2971 [Saprospira grandis str. Lewin]|uniref:Uncharacterized protein n=1 Tax=Saprospira grandis (strain Lewin) TaxID=984262 RepID=H6LAV6_SAPGL|nr:hypothetical protein SGRA_2971 [Saprospira grandis str. Lewin]
MRSFCRGQAAKPPQAELPGRVAEGQTQVFERSEKTAGPSRPASPKGSDPTDNS